MSGREELSAPGAAIGGVRTGAAADGTSAADAFVATWQAAQAALCPIFGERGMAALFQRSVQLTARRHPALARPSRLEGELDLQDLRAELALRDEAEAAAASAELWRIFCELLGTLVGPALTARLLRSVGPCADQRPGEPELLR
jgi:hypothetical protein